MGRHESPLAQLERVELGQLALQAAVLIDARLDCWDEMTPQEQDTWTRQAAAVLSEIARANHG